MEAIFEDICFHVTHYTLTVAPEGTVTSWLAAEAGRQTRRQRDTRGRTAPQRPGWWDQRREPWTRNTAEGSAPWNRSSGRSYPAHAFQLQPTRSCGFFPIPTQVVPTLFWLTHAPPSFFILRLSWHSKDTWGAKGTGGLWRSHKHIQIWPKMLKWCFIGSNGVVLLPQASLYSVQS